MGPKKKIAVETFDHIGIRVRDEDRALEFYQMLGFQVAHRSESDAVVIIKNQQNLEINLVVNANNPDGDQNILMDIQTKFPGFTHMALRVKSISETIQALGENGIEITQGPVSFGQAGNVSVFIRDPDRNTIELRGQMEISENLSDISQYKPN
ncbi:MAG: VOC family protein [Alphaproteobacteria bacterium]